MVYKTIILIVLHLLRSSLADCPPLRPPVNGGLDRSCGTRVGNVCRIYCKTNCQLIGDRVRTCRSDNTWSGSPTFCVDKRHRCRHQLNPPQNGYQVGNCYNFVTFVCNFACNSGYSLVGSSRVVCQRNGHWTARPTCVASVPTTCEPDTTTTQQSAQVYCPELEVPDNGVLAGSCEVSPPRSVCRFSCNPGYQLVGNSTRVCQTSGQWTGSEVECSARVKCPSQSAPANGLIYGYCSPGVSGQSCNFVCNTGYTLVGSSSIACQSNGQWSASAPVCQH